ncbi:MAG: nucleoside-diphosphate sugar epimerase/dehydratase [Bacteroidia bacterium]|nr:nucleoside-diphosphate sugar epimerase/dehydratase [Bacteroidia bacterium]
MRSIVNKITGWYFTKNAFPYWVIMALDCAIVISAGLLSHALTVGVVHTLQVFWHLLFTLLCYMVFYLIGFRVTHCYSGVMRYSSFVDLTRVAYSNLIAIVLIFGTRKIINIDAILMPLGWKELVSTFIIATTFMWTTRILAKYLYDVYFVSASAQRVFIYGAAEGGIALAKSIRSTESQYVVAGFISDNPKDWSHLLMGVKVYPNNENIVEKMRQKQAHVLMVSPNKMEDLRNNQDMIDRLANAGIKMLVYSNHEWDGKADLRHTQLKEVDIEDLLPRNQIEVDLEAIRSVLENKCILITGAAGSIGSEITRQVASFKPSQLILIDQAETPLHNIRLMMKREFPDIPAETITASICHPIHMDTIFKQYKPEYVFHAAAYKHVPMMEDNPGEAVANNIDGTRIVADLSVKYGTKKFVMVSTDKAVNPTNVMGCSKRLCEMYCQSLDKAIKEGTIKGETRFVTTRFGNVLGSNGSVIPLFKEQIRTGGPLTVTHPDIIRYFMLIPEACKLVLQAGTMGHGSEIFVFDMGKPVKIADLAKRMITLSGATDVEIKYTGLRDGEKLYEELLNKEENTVPSSHPKIKVAMVRELGYEIVKAELDELAEITKRGYDDMSIVKKMKEIVPEFKSKHSKYEELD